MDLYTPSTGLNKSCKCYFDSVEYLDLPSTQKHRDIDELQCTEFKSRPERNNDILLIIDTICNSIKKNMQCYTSCHRFAALGQSTEACNSLVSTVNLNQKGPNGQTLFHMAVIQKNVVLQYVLLRSNADVSIKDAEQKYPMDYDLRTKEIIEDHIYKSMENEHVLNVCLCWNKWMDSLFVVCRTAANVNASSFWKNGLWVTFVDVDTSESKFMTSYKNVKHENKHFEKPSVSVFDAKFLFQKHSNLNMISPSYHRSIRFSDKKQFRVQPVPCVVLYCYHKGYIPYAEQLFPNLVNGFRTDVREGYCYFTSAAPGGCISRLPLHKTGTLGGFVDLPGSQVGFLTCAHVLYAFDELRNNRLNTGQTVVQAGSVLGKIENAKFNTNDDTVASVDAALVRLNSNTIISHKFPDISQCQLNRTGMYVKMLTKFSYMNRPFLNALLWRLHLLL